MSENGEQVTMRGSVLGPSAPPKGFTTDPYVLVQDGFSSGITPEGGIFTLGRLRSGGGSRVKWKKRKDLPLPDGGDLGCRVTRGQY